MTNGIRIFNGTVFHVKNGKVIKVDTAKNETVHDFGVESWDDANYVSADEYMYLANGNY